MPQRKGHILDIYNEYEKVLTERIFRNEPQKKSHSKRVFVVVPFHILNVVGGGQKALSNLANTLAKNNYDVRILYVGSKRENIAFKFQRNIIFENLYDSNDKYNSLADKFDLYVQNNKPDLMIFFFINSLRKALKDNYYPNVPKILMHHSRPDIYYKSSVASKVNLVKKLNKYGNFYCHVLFESFKLCLKKYFSVPTFVIANSIDEQKEHINTESENKKIIYLSRIAKEKGQDFLIKSFSLIAKKYPDWTLNIYGDYDSEKTKIELSKLVKDLDLTNQVIIHGVTKEPIQRLLECDFCVFPSYFEGFGLGLAEALSLGLPSIGLKTCSGVNQIIKDGFNGFLTDKNEKLFAQKIEELITNKNLRTEMSKNAIKSVEKFYPQNIESLWIQTIDSIINGEVPALVKTIRHKDIIGSEDNA